MSHVLMNCENVLSSMQSSSFMKDVESALGSIFILYLAMSPIVCTFFNLLNFGSLSSMPIGEMFFNSFFIKKQWLAPAIISIYAISCAIVTLYSMFFKDGYRSLFESRLKTIVQICSGFTWMALVLPSRESTQNLGVMYSMDIALILIIQALLVSIGRLPVYTIFLGPSGACVEYLKLYPRPLSFNLTTIARTLFTVMLAIPLTYKLRDVPQEHFYDLIRLANPIEVFAFIHVIMISLTIGFHMVPIYSTDIRISFTIQTLLLMACVNFNVACAWALVL